MRPIKLVPALAAALALLALTAAGASARPAGHNKTALAGSSCRVTISLTEHVITAGETVSVIGRPHCPGGASTAALPAAVYQHEDMTSPALKLIGSPTSSPFDLSSGPISFDSSFYAVVNGARSATRKVRVAPQVVLNAPTSFPDGAQLLTGRRNQVRFTGTVNPATSADNGAGVFLEREEATSNEEWHAIQGSTVREGAFSFLHTFVVPGAANLRVTVRPHGPFGARGISNALSYEISQPENPKLTILSSADPVPYGQTVTLSGVVAGVTAPTAVTLLANTHSGTGFSSVASGMTDSTGKYSFPVPAVQNTSYHVTSATAKSTVLFEGVKNVLAMTALPPATMVSGQTFTVSGVVTPARPGHPVYLERENAFHGGFHTITVGSELAGGVFSISRTVTSSTKPETFRIKIPGDPVLQAVSSSPFTTVVSPAPLGPILPVAPTTLPH
jgi:hypothetical protein